MIKDKFIFEDIEFFLPEKFKGLTKNYMLLAIFDKRIQRKWIPEKGDIIVGSTGNIFVISNIDNLHENLGGKRYFYGGATCSRNDGNFMNSTQCYTMNDSGVYISWNNVGNLVALENSYHSSYKNMRFIPYPHETNRM